MNVVFGRAGAALVLLLVPAVLAGCTRGSPKAQPDVSPSVLGAQLQRDAEPAVSPLPSPTGPVEAAISEAAGVEVFAGYGAVWIAGFEDVLRVDPATNKVVEAIDVDGFPTALGIGAGAVWATTFRQAATLEQDLVRIDPKTNKVTARIPAGDVVQDLAVSDDAVWILTGGDIDRPAVKLVHVDPATAKVVSTVEPPGLSSLFVRVVAGPEGAFVMSGGKAATLTHVHPDDRVGATIPLPAAPSGGMSYVGGAVFLVNRDTNALTKVDAGGDRVVGTFQLPPLPAYLGAGGGRLWVTVDPTSVAPIDPATGAVGPVLTVDAEAAKNPDTERRIKGIAVDDGGLWLVTAAGAWRVRPPS